MKRLVLFVLLFLAMDSEFAACSQLNTVLAPSPVVSQQANNHHAQVLEFISKFTTNLFQQLDDDKPSANDASVNSKLKPHASISAPGSSSNTPQQRFIAAFLGHKQDPVDIQCHPGEYKTRTGCERKSCNGIINWSHRYS